MRKLDRKRISVPKSITDANSVGVLETTAAISFYSKKHWDKKSSFAYSAYANEEVKKAVSALSDNKCAYCESAARAGFDGDIEHFRPKGEVTIENEDSVKPGYYWLAADWNNLFLSCQHCNQSRVLLTHLGTKKTMGKKNRFPLSDNRKRLRSPKGKIIDEEPYRLLINPAKEDPMKYLYYDEHGLIFPKLDESRRAFVKGDMSIDVFGLLRMDLVQAREKHALIVMAALESLAQNTKDLNDHLGDFKRSYITQRKRLIEKQIELLKVFTRQDQVYSAMAKQLIQNFLSKMGIVFK